ncbi:hypothetical protein WJX81_000875 [Elliptochloris bilobata]|uniref:procollagen-lysine 5-dioxygenase n=1 Tax=Elliptochloris bilobata TaxID=381761 RepID=A0AAW1QAE3_9CHLO
MVLDGFLAPADVQAVRADAEAALAAVGRAARVGGRAPTQAPQRGDTARFLRRDEEAAAGRAALAAALGLLLAVQRRLVAGGCDAGGSTSFQVACYPGNGACYERHADASPSAPARCATAVLYLNPGPWDARRDGGELRLYPFGESALHGMGCEGGEATTLVPPVGGRLVIFDSRIEHEVLPARLCRYALTAWPTSIEAPGELEFCETQRPSSGAPSARNQPPRDARVTHPQRIFVSVAAYRDEEAQWTVAHLLRQAARPERVRVGIVWQVDETEDAAFIRIAGSAAERAKWASQVREVRMDWRQAAGPCLARALAQTLWAGEGFYLQIDAHSRFGRHWDSALIGWLADAEAASVCSRAVLSTYPPDYEGTGAAALTPEDDRPTLLCGAGFGEDGFLRLRGRRLAARAPAPLPSLFWAAGLSFSRAELFLELPYEPLRFLFFGEESFQLARMWAAGWDVLAPPASVVFHKWSRAGRHTFQAEVPQDADAKAASRSHVMALLGRCTWPATC